MSTQHLASDVLIDPRFVLQEVLIHGESALYRSIGHNLLLNLVGLATNRVRGASKVLVVSILDRVAALALLHTLGRL